MLPSLVHSSISSVGGIISKGVGYVTSSPSGSGAASSSQEAKLARQARLSEHDFEDFNDLLTLNDRIAAELSDGFSAEDIKKYELNPPRVIVVGLTSAGKSSLLERILGHSIFPVRDTVCTRRPFRVLLKKEPTVEGSVLTFGHMNQKFSLPGDLQAVRAAIESEQKSESSDVKFNSQEIHAEVRSNNKETFAFTDLPGIFLVSEAKMGQDYKQSREENERLKQNTLDITKTYLRQPNTIVLVVISATDWIHSMNNDNLISYLAEWLEEVRKEGREVPVYGVITKLDTQSELAAGSPLRKIFTNQLPKDHILHGLKVRKWIPVVSSPAVLANGSGEAASRLEREAVVKCLKGAIPSQELSRMLIGRSILLRELKLALLRAISETHGTMRKSIDVALLDIDGKLKRLPQVATDSEKRRIFDARLKTLETSLNDLVGARGGHLASPLDQRSLRMQLMVDAPAQFEKDLNSTELRGDIIAEVKQILNQAALEQGGSFDSDVSFNTLSVKIIERFQKPCLKLVDRCAEIIQEAFRVAGSKAFSDYKRLEFLILAELGVPNDDPLAGSSSEDENDLTRLFPFLKASARSKVLNVLDAYQTMTSFHPMWREFDLLHSNILTKEVKQEAKKSDSKDPDEMTGFTAERTLQHILKLPELAQVVKREGDFAIQKYEEETKQKLSLANKLKISKHFARVEVMGYIVRMSLISSVFPLVLRDLRDGLFRGVKFGPTSWDHSVSTHLRTKLLFDPDNEKKVFALMEPSPEDKDKRDQLNKKRESLQSLRGEFNQCQDKLHQLIELLK